MSFLTDRALPASFNGAEFLMLDSSIETGRKNVVHKFPNKDLPFIEDLGAEGRIFAIRAAVSGFFYEENKKILERQLSTSDPGILVHPYLGAIVCKALTYTVDEDNTKIGTAFYSISFQETTDVNVYPSIDTSDNRTKIAELYEKLYEYIRDNLDGLFILKYISNIEFYLQKLTDISNTLKLFSRNKIDTTDIRNRDFFNKSTFFDDNKARFLTGKKSIGSGFSDLFIAYDLLSENPQSRFDNSLKLAGFGQDDSFIITDNKIGVKRNYNLQLLNGVVNTLALTNIFDAAKDLTYTNELYLTNISSQVEKAFNNVIDNPNSIFLDSDIYDLLLSIRGEERKFFEEQKLIVKQIINIQTNKIPLAALTYNYYGNLDDYNDLLSLNDVYTPSNVSGNLRVYKP